MKVIFLFAAIVILFMAIGCVSACMLSSRISQQEEKNRFKEELWKNLKEDFID